MRPAVLIALGVLGAGVAAAISGGGDGRPEAPDVPQVPETGETRQHIQLMADALGLDSSWTMFLEAAAAGESGFNTLAGRGITTGAPSFAKIYSSSAEAVAARRAYDRNAADLEACPWDVDRYSFGSGGLWALLPANGLAAFRGTSDICMDPWSVFYPAPAIAMVLAMCERLMRYSAFQSVPTWGNLRVGMRAHTRMGVMSEIDRMREGKNKLGDRLEQLGYHRGFVDELVTPLPSRSAVAALRIVEQV